MTLLRIPILTTLHLSSCMRAKHLVFWTSIFLALILVCGLYFSLSGTMEIDKAVKECDDRRLKTKYANAIYVIQRALALYSVEEVAFSFNGGKDSTVLLHLLRAGHYLSEANQRSPNGNLKGFPFRTIYFESSSAFSEINSFTHGIATMYALQMEVIHTDFKSGLEDLIKSKSIRAIFLGVRIGDPTAVGQEQFSPSSPGWPPFMRVNPILDWSYRDVWAFLLISKVPYCCLYDQGYTSIGSIHDTVPNALLRSGDSASSEEKFRPAYMLSDGRLERAGRVKKHSSSAHGVSPSSDGMYKLDFNNGSVLTTSIIAVGDEILSDPALLRITWGQSCVKSFILLVGWCPNLWLYGTMLILWLKKLNR